MLKALRNGVYFVTTGEVPIKEYKIDGAADKRTIMADGQWTYRLSFVEVV